ncbi:hypothetical protein Syun_003290 [Stephania yunnanensis]|uniref:PEP-utilising enzyme C-terminal domain-containing protein n=1 Tax=Stephania yunnanensis TaxID=152371 RepID=A0AAP0L0X3_9MAGN
MTEAARRDGETERDGKTEETRRAPRDRTAKRRPPGADVESEHRSDQLARPDGEARRSSGMDDKWTMNVPAVDGGLLKPDVVEARDLHLSGMLLRASKEGPCDLKDGADTLYMGDICKTWTREQELEHQVSLIRDVSKKVFSEMGTSIGYKIGTMIEIPRAALVADEIAEQVEFFSFGTNDLTQMTFGYSRDDVGKFLPIYLPKGILQHDPFEDGTDTLYMGNICKTWTREQELEHQVSLIRDVSKKVFSEMGTSIGYKIGTMIEIPRAALVADEIAEQVEFFSFGTNDLTQMTFGYSRDDVGKFLPIYLSMGILQHDPFEVHLIDTLFAISDA